MHPTGDQHKQNPETGDIIVHVEEYPEIMRLNFILLNIFGLLPPTRAGPLMKFIYKMFIAAVMLMDVLILLGQVLAVVVYWGNLELISAIVGVMNGFAVAFISCAYFVINKEKILMLVDIMRDKFVATTKSKYMNLIKKADSQVVVYLYLSSPVVVCCSFSWGVATVINMNEFSNMETNNVTKTEQNVDKMVFVMWTPFDVQQSPQFEIFSVFQICFVCIGVVTSYTLSVLVLSLMSHSAAQFNILVAMLNDMHENISDNELTAIETAFSANSAIDGGKVFDNETDEECRNGHCSELLRHFNEPDNLDEDKFQRYLINCIKHHESMINFVGRISDVVSIVVFLQIMNLPIILCVTGFQMTQTFDRHEQFFKFCSLSVAALYHIFSYSWFGQQMTNKSEEVATALYSTDWYNQKPGFKRLLLLAIMRASRPVKVKVGVFYDMSFDTFTSIMNVAYKYFAVLIQLNES